MQGMLQNKNINQIAEEQHEILIIGEQATMLSENTEMNDTMKENTKDMVNKFVDKKKEEALEVFINASLVGMELEQAKSEAYSGLIKKYGEGRESNAKSDLKDKARKYVKEKQSIVNNKMYSEEKKDRKLRELKEDTKKGIKGYEEYEKEIAFGDKGSSFRAEMRKEGFSDRARTQKLGDRISRKDALDLTPEEVENMTDDELMKITKREALGLTEAECEDLQSIKTVLYGDYKVVKNIRARAAIYKEIPDYDKKDYIGYIVKLNNEHNIQSHLSFVRNNWKTGDIEYAQAEVKTKSRYSAVEKKEANKEKLTEKDRASKVLVNDPVLFGTKITGLLRGAIYVNFRGFEDMSLDEKCDMIKNVSGEYIDENAGNNLKQSVPGSQRQQVQEEGITKLFQGYVKHFDYLTRKYGDSLGKLTAKELFLISPTIGPDLNIAANVDAMLPGLKTLVDEKHIKVDREIVERCFDQMKYFQSILSKIMYLDGTLRMMNAEAKGAATKQLVEQKLTSMEGDNGYVDFVNESKEYETKIFDDERYARKDKINFNARVKSMEEIERASELSKLSPEKMRQVVIEEEKQKILNKGLEKDAEAYKAIMEKEKSTEKNNGAEDIGNRAAMDYRAELLKLKESVYNRQSERIEKNTKVATEKFINERKTQIWEELVQSVSKSKFRNKGEKLQIKDSLYEDLAEKQTGITLEEKIGLYKAQAEEIRNKNYGKDKEARKLRELQAKTIEGIQGYNRYMENLMLGTEETKNLFKSDMRTAGLNSELNVINMDLKAADKRAQAKVEFYNAQKNLKEKAIASIGQENPTQEQVDKATMDYVLQEYKDNCIARGNREAANINEGESFFNSSARENSIERRTPMAGINYLNDIVNYIKAAPMTGESIAKNMQLIKFVSNKYGKLEEAHEKKSYGNWLRQLPQDLKESIDKLTDKPKKLMEKLEIENFLVVDKDITVSDKVDRVINDTKGQIFEKMNKVKTAKENELKNSKNVKSPYIERVYSDKDIKAAAAEDFNDNIEKNIRAFAKATEGADINEARIKKEIGGKHSDSERRLLTLQTSKNLAGVSLEQPLFNQGVNTFKNFKGFTFMSEAELTEMFKNMQNDSPKAIEAWIKPFSKALVMQFNYLTKKYGKGLMDLPKEQFVNIYEEFAKDTQSCAAAHNVTNFISKYSAQNDVAVVSDLFHAAKTQEEYFLQLSRMVEERMTKITDGVSNVKESSEHKEGSYAGKINLKAKVESLEEIEQHREKLQEIGNKENIKLLKKKISEISTADREEKLKQANDWKPKLSQKELEQVQDNINSIYDMRDKIKGIMQIIEQKQPKLKTKNPEIFDAILVLTSGIEKSYRSGGGEINLDVIIAYSKATEGSNDESLKKRKEELEVGERRHYNLKKGIICGRDIRETMFRDGGKELANCAGVATMDKDLCRDMFEELGYEGKKIADTIRENKEGLDTFKEIITSQMDYLTRKYGTNMLNLSNSELSSIYLEFQKDMNQLNIAKTLMENEDLFKDSNTKEFDRLKNQVVYFSNVMVVIAARSAVLRSEVQITAEDDDLAMMGEDEEISIGDKRFMERLEPMRSTKKWMPEIDEQGKPLLKEYEVAKAMELKLFDGRVYDLKASINANVIARSAQEIRAEREALNV